MCGNICPCCGSPLLRHAGSRGVYWFCTSCSQEMPTAQMASTLPRKDFFRKEGVRKKPSCRIIVLGGSIFPDFIFRARLLEKPCGKVPYKKEE